MNAFSSIGRGARPVGLVQLAVGDLAGADPLSRGGRRQVEQVAHAAPGLGTPKPSFSGSGAAAKMTSPRQRRLGLVGPQRVDDVDHVRGRRDAVEIELADLLDVVEHLGKLRGHPLDLFLAQLEPGEPGDVENLFTIEHLCSPF